MARPHAFDLVVAGGGIAGSLFAGVMARAGFGVLLVEREAVYRDRVRGEATWPWGVAEAHRCQVREVFRRAGAIDIVGVTRYINRTAEKPYLWATDSIDRLPEMGFVHPRMQETAFQWAIEQGALPMRPAKATTVRVGAQPSIEIQHDGEITDIRARLIVGADGKHSGLRKYTGGKSCADPEWHRFGGALVTGVPWPANTDDYDNTPEWGVNWFPISPEYTRIYLRLTAEEIERTGVTRSFEKFIDFASIATPPGLIEQAVQAGPIAFFPNFDTWTTRIAGEGIALIGDAAGSLDPSQGHGTALLLRDVRELSEALIAGPDWQRAIDGYAARRRAYYDVLHAYDLWVTEIGCTPGIAGDHLRERHQGATEDDPSLGGWNTMEARGPDGLIPDATARARYFGEDR